MYLCILLKLFTINKVIRDNSLLVFPVKRYWMLPTLLFTPFLDVCVCVHAHACVCSLHSQLFLHTWQICDLVCWTTTVSGFFCLVASYPISPLPGYLGGVGLYRCTTENKHECCRVCACIYTVHVDLMPVLQAEWCPAEAHGHPSALLPSPVAAWELASSIGLRLSQTLLSRENQSMITFFLFRQVSQCQLARYQHNMFKNVILFSMDYSCFHNQAQCLGVLRLQLSNISISIYFIRYFHISI